MLNFFNRQSFILYLILLTLAILTIFFQLNFEDLWLDEMNSFYVADPEVSIDETINRHKKTDWHNTMLFNLILKNFLSIFGYDSEIARYLPFIFGGLSIAIIGIISYEIKKDNSYLLTTLLACLSIYIIKYSQEIRPYTLLIFLSSINVYLYVKLNNSNIKIIKYLVFLLFIFFSVLNYSANPFSLIIFFSQISNSLAKFFFFKKKHLLFFIAVPLISIFYIIFNLEYLIFQISFKKYMLSSDIVNVIDGLYFPRFFGSKIMGYFYLISLISLIIFNRKKVFREDNEYLFLTLLFFYTYLIPLLYGLIKTPVLHDRYIIFVLIPIFILISCLSTSLKSTRIKKIFILTIVILTSSNHVIEIFDRKNTKPEFNNILNYIKNTNNKDIIFYNPKDTSELVLNYINNLNEEKNYNLKIYNFNKTSEVLNYAWFLCYTPMVNFNCKIPNTLEWQKISTIKFLHVEAHLFKLN